MLGTIFIPSLTKSLAIGNANLPDTGTNARESRDFKQTKDDLKAEGSFGSPSYGGYSGVNSLYGQNAFSSYGSSWVKSQSSNTSCNIFLILPFRYGGLGIGGYGGLQNGLGGIGAGYGGKNVKTIIATNHF